MQFKLVRQYTVFIPNAPGALCKFVELFQKANINIVGIASEVRDDSGVVRIAIDSDEPSSKIITDAGYTTIETFLLSYEIPDDKPGSLLYLAKILGDNGINITTVYGTSFAGDKGRIFFNVSDTEKALKILKEETQK